MAAPTMVSEWPVGIDIGGVDEIDAPVGGVVDDAPRVRLVRWQPPNIMAPRQISDTLMPLDASTR